MRFTTIFVIASVPLAFGIPIEKQARQSEPSQLDIFLTGIETLLKETPIVGPDLDDGTGVFAIIKERNARENGGEYGGLLSKAKRQLLETIQGLVLTLAGEIPGTESLLELPAVETVVVLLPAIDELVPL